MTLSSYLTLVLETLGSCSRIVLSIERPRESFSSGGTSAGDSLHGYLSSALAGLTARSSNDTFAFRWAAFAILAAASAALLTEDLVSRLVDEKPQAPFENARMPIPASEADDIVFVLPSMTTMFVPVDSSIRRSTNDAPALRACSMASSARSSIL